MILKTLTHDHGEGDCWTWYDGVQQAFTFVDKDLDAVCITIIFRDPNATRTIALREVAYLCNDQGQTIEKLFPKVFSKDKKEVTL